jgi:hypothetical protein
MINIPSLPTDNLNRAQRRAFDKANKKNDKNTKTNYKNNYY